MSSGVWLFAGLMLLVWPARRSPVTPTPRPTLSPSWAGAIVAVSAGVVLVLLLGPTTGMVAGLVLGPALAKGAHRLVLRVEAVPLGREFALTLDLVAAALLSGRPLAGALELATRGDDSAAAEAVRRVAGLLRLGAPPEVAWAVLATGPLRQVAAAAVRSASSGIRLAGAFESLAAEVRAEATAAAAARAARAGVLSVAPLAACFLPSFVCLGVIPVVIGTLRSTGFGVAP